MAMIDVKAYLVVHNSHTDEKASEIKRFYMHPSILKSYTLFLATLEEKFPILRGQRQYYAVSWKDKEGDEIRISCQDDLLPCAYSLTHDKIFRLHILMDSSIFFPTTSRLPRSKGTSEKSTPPESPYSSIESEHDQDEKPATSPAILVHEQQSVHEFSASAGTQTTPSLVQVPISAATTSPNSSSHETREVVRSHGSQTLATPRTGEPIFWGQNYHRTAAVRSKQSLPTGRSQEPQRTHEKIVKDIICKAEERRRGTGSQSDGYLEGLQRTEEERLISEVYNNVEEINKTGGYQFRNQHRPVEMTSAQPLPNRQNSELEVTQEERLISEIYNNAEVIQRYRLFNGQNWRHPVEFGAEESPTIERPQDLQRTQETLVKEVISQAEERRTPSPGLQEHQAPRTLELSEDEKMDRIVTQLRSMGFKNENGWLNHVVKDCKYDLEGILDYIYVNTHFFEAEQPSV